MKKIGIFDKITGKKDKKSSHTPGHSGANSSGLDSHQVAASKGSGSKGSL